MQNIGLRMQRSSLQNLPAAMLPEGFRFGTYGPGDRATWVQVYSAAEPYFEITPALFHREFYSDEASLSQRMIFLYDSTGTAVGTSTAWYDDIGQDPARGRVHWVAIRPELQGQGLGKALLSATLGVLAKLNHTSSCLLTSSARLPALSMYLRFGFVPEIESAEQRAAWREVAGQLLPEFRSAIEAALE